MSFYTERMEQLKMGPMREKHPDWIWNRSDTHMFLKIPEANATFATIVEAGNSFSPGPGTYGVSTWITVDGNLYTPEECELSEFIWEFEEKKYPVSNTEWMAGKIRIRSSLFTWQNGDLIDYRDYFRVTLKNEALEEKSLHFDLVVRSFGAAGGPIKSLREKDGIIFVDGAPLIYAEQKGKFGAISYAETGKDISVFLK